MNKFKIKIKGKEEFYDVKIKINGDMLNAISAIADVLINISIDAEIDEKTFMKNIKNHFKKTLENKNIEKGEE